MCVNNVHELYSTVILPYTIQIRSSFYLCNEGITYVYTKLYIYKMHNIKQNMNVGEIDCMYGKVGYKIEIEVVYLCVIL